MSYICPHDMIVGRCPFGCTVIWAGGDWTKFWFGVAPASWYEARQRRRDRAWYRRLWRWLRPAIHQQDTDRAAR